MFFVIFNGTLCKMGKVDRYWAGGRIKVVKIHCAFNMSLFYAVKVRHRITMLTCIMRCKAKFLFLVIFY